MRECCHVATTLLPGHSTGHVLRTRAKLCFTPAHAVHGAPETGDLGHFVVYSLLLVLCYFEVTRVEIKEEIRIIEAITAVLGQEVEMANKRPC